VKAVSDIVLDASAILALIQNEPGAEKVAAVSPRAIVSAVNLAEVITKLVQKINDPAAVVKHLALLELRVRAWDEEAAQHSAQYAWLAALGLSLGDRACITTAAISGLRVLTADRRWKTIKPIAARIDLIR
jgi:PIN domain nuclease of toxin-antitoxin system